VKWAIKGRAMLSPHLKLVGNYCLYLIHLIFVLIPFFIHILACSQLSVKELASLHNSFQLACRSQREVLDLPTLQAINNSKVTEFAITRIIPRILKAIDIKKDGVIDFEEYLCALILLRFGSPEEKLKLLFLMYDPYKGINGYLTKESVKCLLIDAMSSGLNRSSESSKFYDEWSENLEELPETMTDMVFFQV
jgi:Ca2+-binding EF-hand superfamily protein